MDIVNVLVLLFLGAALGYLTSINFPYIKEDELTDEYINRFVQDSLIYMIDINENILYAYNVFNGKFIGQATDPDSLQKLIREANPGFRYYLGLARYIPKDLMGVEKDESV